MQNSIKELHKESICIHGRESLGSEEKQSCVGVVATFHSLFYGKLSTLVTSNHENAKFIHSKEVKFIFSLK
jgi:hypothetical protein